MRIESVRSDAFGNAIVAVSGGICFFIPQGAEELSSLGFGDFDSLRAALETAAASGAELDPEDELMTALAGADERLRAERKALELCARAEQHSSGLKAKLAARGFSRRAVDAALEGAIREGALDDARYAAVWAGARARRKLCGPILLARELRSRGLDQSSVDEGLGTIDFQPILDKLVENLRASGSDGRTIGRQLAERGFGNREVRDALESIDPSHSAQQCNT